MTPTNLDGVGRLTGAGWRRMRRCVAGKWRCEGVNATGQAFAVEGEYTRVDPPHSLGPTFR